MNDSQYKELCDNLKREVRYLALGAASWVFDGNTAEETYRRVSAGLADGDPEIIDALPGIDWSGQWADGPCWELLITECLPDGYEPTPGDDYDALTDELFFDIGQDYGWEVYFGEVERIARYQTDDAG